MNWFFGFILGFAAVSAIGYFVILMVFVVYEGSRPRAEPATAHEKAEIERFQQGAAIKTGLGIGFLWLLIKILGR